MENQFELQQLLQRQNEIRQAMRQPGGIRITVERELHAIDERLKRYPAALVQRLRPLVSPNLPTRR